MNFRSLSEFGEAQLVSKCPKISIEVWRIILHKWLYVNVEIDSLETITAPLVEDCLDFDTYQINWNTQSDNLMNPLTNKQFLFVKTSFAVSSSIALRLRSWEPHIVCC